MDQIVLASLSHTHYRYEVGMLKVPVSIDMIVSRDRASMAFTAKGFPVAPVVLELCVLPSLRPGSCLYVVLERATKATTDKVLDCRAAINIGLDP